MSAMALEARMEAQSLEPKDNYHTPPAATILRWTRSSNHCVLHQSTGVTCCPPTSIVKCR